MKVDRYIFYSCVALICISIIFSLSLSAYPAINYDDDLHFFKRQAFIGVVSVILMILISKLDADKHLALIGFSIFGISIFLMIIMQILPSSIVSSVGGAKRWIKLPGFSIAPVEFLKIGLIYFLAWSFPRKLNENKKNIKELFKILLPYMYVFATISSFIIFSQNDLGQVVLLGLILAFMAFISTINYRIFIIFGVPLIIAASIAIIAYPHRIYRIKSWLASISDNGTNISEFFQISQSLNAIKNGGLFGQGLGNGTFKLGFLSEVHTDFVISGISEEVGFIGILIIVSIMLFLIFRIFSNGSKTDNKVYYLFGIGAGLLITFSFVINSYGISGIIPIKGIAVPFLSYGGSSMLAHSILIGMMLMISKKRVR